MRRCKDIAAQAEHGMGIIIMKRSGVSPLIATVLLIAFTLAIGAFMSTWMQSMARTQTQTASENADAGCSYMNINLNSATYNESGNNRLILALENAGTKNAVVSTIRVTGSNLNSTIYTHPGNFTGTLNTGDEITLSLTINATLIDSISKLRIIPADCPGSAIDVVSTEITSYD